jgi:hypothetical protein
MEFKQFVATTPAVKPATSEVVYDKYWLSNMRVEAGDPTKPVKLIAVFTPARDMTIQLPKKDAEGNAVVDEDGDPVLETITYKELMPNAQPKRLVINDVFKEAVLDPTNMGMAMNTVFNLLNDKAVEKGIL